MVTSWPFAVASVVRVFKSHRFHVRFFESTTKFAELRENSEDFCVGKTNLRTFMDERESITVWHSFSTKMKKKKQEQRNLPDFYSDRATNPFQCRKQRYEIRRNETERIYCWGWPGRRKNVLEWFKRLRSSSVCVRRPSTVATALNIPIVSHERFECCW